MTLAKRLLVDAILERARAQASAGERDKPPLGPLAARRFEPFTKTLQSCDLTRLMEWQTIDKATYRKKLAEALGITP